VLAYSTVSQLGYMFLAAGLGAYTAAIFHLGTHAFFKALLFLGSGSVIHAMGGEQDMRRMGGLEKYLPVTYRTFLVGTVAIAGIPPLAGFFSKDQILEHTFAAGGAYRVLWAVGLITAGLTACYMFRAVYLTFHGEFRGTAEERSHLHESPPVMTMPLVVLAVGAVTAGWIGVSQVLALGTDVNWLHHWLEPVVVAMGAEAGHGAAMTEHGEGAAHLSLGVEWLLIAIAVAVAVSGILLARNLFFRRPMEGEEKLIGRLGAAHPVLANKYWVDELYDRVVIRPLAALSRGFWKIVDGGIIDGFLHLTSAVAEIVGDLGRFSTTGNARNYVLYFFLGIVILLGWIVF
jgi:NADH-quinone oxidoreductase subunit L